MKFLTIKKFSQDSGYSEKAIRQKISDGTWPENIIWAKAPDNRLLINTEGFETWVTKAKALSRSVRPVFKSRSPIKGKHAGKTSSASPQPLTLK